MLRNYSTHIYIRPTPYTISLPRLSCTVNIRPHGFATHQEQFKGNINLVCLPNNGDNYVTLLTSILKPFVLNQTIIFFPFISNIHPNHSFTMHRTPSLYKTSYRHASLSVTMYAPRLERELPAITMHPKDLPCTLRPHQTPHDNTMHPTTSPCTP